MQARCACEENTATAKEILFSKTDLAYQNGAIQREGKETPRWRGSVRVDEICDTDTKFKPFIDCALICHLQAVLS